MDQVLNPPIHPPQPSIDLYRARDVGGIVNTVFALLRENARGLARALLVIVGPVVVFSIIVQLRADLTWDFGAQIAMSYVVDSIISVFTQTIIIAYVLLYIERGRHGVELRDVWAVVRSDIAAVIALSIVTTIASGLAMLLLIIPGIYLFVALSLSVPVRMSEESTLMSAMSRSVDLVRGYWWETLGLLILVGILGFALSFALSAPDLLAMELVPELIADNITIYTIVRSLLEGVGSVVFSLVVDTALIVHYFNLLERKESPGAIARIEEIGDVAESMPLQSDLNDATNHPN